MAAQFNEDERSHGSFLKCMRPKERFSLPRPKPRAASVSMPTGSPPTPKRRFFSMERTRASSIHYQIGQPPTATCDCLGAKSFRCQYAIYGTDNSPATSPSRGRHTMAGAAHAHKEIEMTSIVTSKKKKWEEKFISKEWEIEWLQKWRKRTMEEECHQNDECISGGLRPSLGTPTERRRDSHAGFRRRSLSDAGHMGFMGFSLGQWQVDTMLRAGIPIEYRGQVWWLCSGAAQKRAAATPAEQYDSLLWRADEVLVEVANEIEKDLYRTFPHEPDTREEREASISELRRLLSMYSLRNPKVGYCQSMNFLAAMLLVYLAEEEAFWVLACIVEDLVPGYHTKSMIGSRVDQHVFAALVDQKLPQVARHLSALHVHLAPVTFKWFLCLFVNTLPLETTLRVWDVFFSEGSKVIHRLGLTLLKLLAPEILEAEEAFDVYELLKFTPRTMNALLAPHRKPHVASQWRKHDDCFCDTLIRLAFDKAFLGPFPYSTIVELRGIYHALVEEELAEAEEERAARITADTHPASSRQRQRNQSSSGKDEYDFVDDFKTEEMEYDFLVASGCFAESQSWRNGAAAAAKAGVTTTSTGTERSNSLIENYW